MPYLRLSVILILFSLLLFCSCSEQESLTPEKPATSISTPSETSVPTVEQTSLPPIEAGKGRIILENLESSTGNITVRKITDSFLIGVGTTDPGGCVSSGFLKELRTNGINLFLPFPAWASGNNPCPGVETILWLERSGATLNGHCLVFFLDEPWCVPQSVFNLTFDEQKAALEKHVKTTVARFPGIEIWDLNEPVAQNCLGWTREQLYDVFVACSQWIHEVNPEAKVLLNMIPIQCNWGGLDYDPSQVADDLFQRGIEADIIGIELYHFFAPEDQCDENGYPKIEWIREKTDIFRKYNLPILFSEIGVPGIMNENEQFEQQADWMESFFQFCHDDNDIIGAVWYFVRDDSFMPYAGLANNDYSYRPVGERLIEISNEWNPPINYNLSGNYYLDLEPGEYDIIINEKTVKVYRVNVTSGQTTNITSGE